MIKDCSGGQQRRVSIAVAMVHEPELLILDEPTVGMDPLLRENIWTYFLEKSEKKNIAVIVTTHYIEETKFAHKVLTIVQRLIYIYRSKARSVQILLHDI